MSELFLDNEFSSEIKMESGAKTGILLFMALGFREERPEKGSKQETGKP
jgi:hypothetical protein